jgi:O-antigen/teichoic acid export membrane protein
MKFKVSGLLKDTIIYGVGDFIVTGVNGFLLLPIYVQYLGEEQYGLYGLYTMSLTLFTYLIQLGLISGFSRVFFIYEPADRQRYMNTILTFHTLYIVALTAVFFLVSEPLRQGMSPALPPEFFFMSYLTSFLTFLPALYAIRYRLQQETVRFVRIQVVTVILIVAAVLVVLPLMRGNLRDLLYGLAVANGLMWMFFVIKSLPAYKVSLDKKAISETFKIALPVFLSYVMLFVVNKFGLIILQRHVDLEEVGLFSFFQQLSGVLLIISIAAGKALQPVIFASNKEDLERTFERRDRNYKNALFFISALLIIYSKEFILVFFNDFYTLRLEVFYMLVLSGYLFTSILLQNTVLQYFLKSKWLFNCVLVSGVTSIVFNLFLVPRMQLNGAGIAAILSLLAMAGLNRWYTHRLVRHERRFGDLIPLLKLALVGFSVYFIGRLTDSIWIGSLIKTLLALLLLADVYFLGGFKSFIKEMRAKA